MTRMTRMTSPHRAAVRPALSWTIPAGLSDPGRPSTAGPAAASRLTFRRALWRGGAAQLPDLAPGDEDDAVRRERLLELRARDDLIVALPPRGAVVGVVDHHRLQLGVVVAEVDDHLG